MSIFINITITAQKQECNKGDSFGVPNILGNTSDLPKIQFNLPHQFFIDTSTDKTGIVEDNYGSLCTWGTDLSEETAVQQDGNKSNEMGVEKNSQSGTNHNNHTNGSNGTNASYSATVAAPDNRQEGSGDA